MHWKQPIRWNWLPGLIERNTDSTAWLKAY